MELEITEIGPGAWHAGAEHVGWMLVAEGDEVTLVDTGYPGNRDALVASLARIGRTPSDVAAVVLTHAHPDHLGSAEHLRTSVGAPVWVHEEEARHARGEVIEQVSTLTLVRMLWRRDVERLGAVETFGDQPLDVPGRPRPLHAPGHTRGHSALHFSDRGVLHVGDGMMTAHRMSRRTGPQPALAFFDADHQQALASLRSFAPLAADVVVVGHGPPFHGSPGQAVELALAG
jgi:glyoxylase-like metal-dependent hydrolase (beta-lactamase superfamily II)